MALSTNSNKVVHNGNGVATNFAYTFPILEATHLQVIYTDAGGNSTTLGASLYSVTGIGVPAGGSVTYPLSGLALALGETLTIMRVVPLTQSTVFSNQGGYYPEVVEGRFDRVFMGLQQLQEQIDRTVIDPPAATPGHVVASLADLLALTWRPEAVLVKGLVTAGDGGGGVFNWFAGDTSTVIYGMVGSPTLGTAGRYKRDWAGELNALWLGADRTGDSSSTTAVANMYTLLDAVGGGSMYFPRGLYDIAAFPGFVQDGIYIRGDGRGATVLAPSAATGDFISFGTLASITKSCGVRDLTITPSVVRTQDALVHVNGAGWVDIDRVDLNNGYNGLEINNYGNEAQVWVERVKITGCTNKGIDLGSDSIGPVNEVFLNDLVLATCGVGVSFSYVSGIYGANVALYQCTSNTVQLIPATGITRHGFGPFNEAIYGIDVATWNADSGGADGFYLGGTGIISEVTFADSLASSCAGRGMHTVTGPTINDVNFPGFKSTHNGLDGVKLENGKNLRFPRHRIYYNNTTNNADAHGVYVSAALVGVEFTNGFSGVGGYAESLSGATNYQKYGYKIAASCTYSSFAGLHALNNVTGTSANAVTGVGTLYVPPDVGVLPLTGGTINGNLQVNGTLVSIGQVLTTDGSAAAPAYSNGGFTNTGFFFPSSNQIGVTLGGVHKITMSPNAFNLASGSAFQINASQVVGARDTGWGAMTGTTNKATVYDTATVSLPQLAGRVMALQAAFTTHGLIGA